MAIFMKINGITGSVSAKQFEGWIALDSLSQGMSRAMKALVAGEVKNRTPGRNAFQEFSIQKSVDSASSALFSKACQSEFIPEVIIRCVKTQKEVLQTYLEYTLENVLISRIDKHITTNDASESLSLSYTKIHERFIPTASSGQSASPSSAGYNIETAEVI